MKTKHYLLAILPGCEPYLYDQPEPNREAVVRLARRKWGAGKADGLLHLVTDNKGGLSVDALSNWEMNA